MADTVGGSGSGPGSVLDAAAAASVDVGNPRQQPLACKGLLPQRQTAELCTQ